MKRKEGGGDHLVDDSEDLRGVDDLLLKVYPVQGDHGCQDRVED